jgi:RNA methyltransferase, TrmH family
MQIGKHSPKMIELRKALRAGTLTSSGLLPVEGPTLLEEAQRSGAEIVDLFVCEEARVPAVAAQTLYDVPLEIFKTIQQTEHSQGVVATVRPRQFTVADIVNVFPPLIVILCRLQDPGNAGTILRIAESFGATGCIAVRGTVSLHNSKLVRASAGSIFRLPHVGGTDAAELVGMLRAKGLAIAGTSPTGEIHIDKWDWRQPAAVLVGNEGSGLSSEEFRYCDAILQVPHKRTVESLNSAVAAAVTLYEAFKQRSQVE